MLLQMSKDEEWDQGESFQKGTGNGSGSCSLPVTVLRRTCTLSHEVE